MLHRFQYVTQQDKNISNQWNPEVPNPTQIDHNNSAHFIARFNITLLQEFPLEWLENNEDESISVLLVHYNPLRNILDRLIDQSIGHHDLEQFRDSDSALSQEYGGQIISFQSEMNDQGNRFGLDVVDMANQAELIVCCFGEFMESPYKEKHVFQGNSRGSVFVTDSPEGYFQTQALSSYSGIHLGEI